MLGFYLMLHDAHRLQVPVIEYAELLVHSSDNLWQYLAAFATF